MSHLNLVGGEEEAPVQEYASDQDSEGSEDRGLEELLADPKRPSKMNVMYPKETELPDYRSLKRIKLNDNTGLPVIINDLANFIDPVSLFKQKYNPEAVKVKIIPKLQEIVRQSSGTFEEFVIWPEFLVYKNTDLVEGRPKRDGTYKF